MFFHLETHCKQNNKIIVLIIDKVIYEDKYSIIFLEV